MMNPFTKGHVRRVSELLWDISEELTQALGDETLTKAERDALTEIAFSAIDLNHKTVDVVYKDI